jgi:hypothetical protein
MDATVILLLIACVGCVAVGLSVVAAWVYFGDTATEDGGDDNEDKDDDDNEDKDDDDEKVTDVTDEKDLKEDERYLIGRKETWLTMDYDGSRPRGKQCDVKDGMVKASSANDFQFTKQSGSWIIATDCDEDGKYTSYLSNKASDLIQARDKKDAKKTQRWTVSCNEDGCKIRNPETKKYLNLSGKTLSLSSSATRVRIASK